MNDNDSEWSCANVQCVWMICIDAGQNAHINWYPIILYVILTQLLTLMK